ncbi:DUF4189 domain-containing protein [Xanthomonas sp. SI]|uniref:DUF4189 domain-containing protein n=1 Tax=Xanthomonas sp. SI TaxID=2724123 RepID=UPI00163B56D2|nr:DUF4189 domain-containing protein [Xanthomonas sp. SI]
MRKFIAVFLFALGYFAGGAVAQTACPVGTAAGSATCGPSVSYVEPPPPQPAGEWDSRFGAVAADMSTSGNTGVAANKTSKEDAINDALEKCRSLGSANCGIVMSYSNQCVAILAPSVNGVERGGSPVTRPGKNVKAATAIAEKDCKKANKSSECSVIYSACSMPVFRRY